MTIKMIDMQKILDIKDGERNFTSCCAIEVTDTCEQLLSLCRDLPDVGTLVETILNTREEMHKRSEEQGLKPSAKVYAMAQAQAILELFTLPSGKAGQSSSEGLRGGGK